MVDRSGRASARKDREVAKQLRLVRTDGPEGGKGASPGSRRRNWREPDESEGRKTSIKKDGSRSPVTGDQEQRAEDLDEVGKA